MAPVPLLLAAVLLSPGAVFRSGGGQHLLTGRGARTALGRPSRTARVLQTVKLTMSTTVAKLDEEQRLFDAFNQLSPQTKKAMAASVEEIVKDVDPRWQNRSLWWGAYRNAVGDADLTAFFKAWVTYSPEPPQSGHPELPSLDHPVGLPDGPGYFIERWDWLSNTQAGLALNAFDDEFRAWFVDFLETHARWIASTDSAVSVPKWMVYQGADLHPFDIDEYEVPQGGFPSFNAFFLRMVKEGSRPVSKADLADDGSIVAPSDGGIFFLTTSSAHEERISLPSKRSDTFNLREAFPGFGENFIGGPILDTLLWFTDFHHFYSPVSGRVISMAEYPGSYNYDFDGFDPYHPDATKPEANSGKAGWYKQLARHKRFVWIVKTERMGLVGMAAIGFWGVGSIVVNHQEDSTAWPSDPKTGEYVTPVKPGDSVKKGQYLGHFGYGGSSIVLAFQGEFDGQNLDFEFRTTECEIGNASAPVLVKAKERIGGIPSGTKGESAGKPLGLLQALETSLHALFSWNARVT